MSTSLWPALLAAVLGGGSGGERRAAVGHEETAFNPIQALLYLSVLGEHALYWWIGIVCFVGLAYATNPSEASFKTHLTDLSFHLHLRRLRGAHDPDIHNTASNNNNSNSSSNLPGHFRRSSSSSGLAAASSLAASSSSSTSGAKISSNPSSSSTGGKSKKDNGNNAAISSSNGTTHSGIEIRQRNASSSSSSVNNNKHHSGSIRETHSNGDAGRPHVLSFSNRVSISLKTPAYVRTSYGLWSTVRILPSTPASSSSSSLHVTSKSGSKASSGNANAAGTPGGRPIVNGVPAMTRRASTTLPSLHDKSSKKSSSSTPMNASSSSSKNSNRKGSAGLVSTVAHNISASIAAPVCSPWLEQGGYFIGFLGYWWTIDDGTSFSGAREKARLGNALLAVVEEQEQVDDDDTASVADQVGHDAARHADDLEGGHVYYDNAQVPASHAAARQDDQSSTTSAPQQVNGNANSSSKRKQPPSKLSHSASMRGGQRRSSPTPRQISTKKRGSESAAAGASSTATNTASQGNSSGDVTPVTPNSAVPLDRSRLERDNAGGGHLLSTNDDSQLPGLPFHVDRSQNTTPGENPQYVKESGTAETVGEDGHGQVRGAYIVKEGEDGISTVSHTASALDSTVSTVSPALALLQSQLDDLRTSSAATQARLEAEVEELQARKRDEDAVRIELKARTKVLEESKREAEAERLDAEKKLIAARSVKKGVEDRVTKARSELSKLEKKEKEVQERIVRAREERRIKLDALRGDVKKREALLVKEEEATEKLNKRVADLEKEIDERKHDLFQFRREEANAAAQAVTNRMNRAGRGLGGAGAGSSSSAGGAGAHTHGHGPHSGAAQTAKRHMHPAAHANSSTTHRQPSQHPNAAVPIAYPYINPEEQGKQASGAGNQGRVSPPVGNVTPPPPQASSTNAAYVLPTAQVDSGAQNFSGTFMDHRMQSRRAASAAGSLGQGGASAAGAPANQPVNSSVNTSVIGNSASAASALYNRQQLDRDDDFDEIDGGSEVKNLIPGSTFAPFGPASPTSPSTIGAPSPRDKHGRLIDSPGVGHMPYFASDKPHQPQRLRLSASRENFLASMRAETAGGDDNAGDTDATPIMGLANELAVDDTEDSYVLAKPRAITDGNRRTGHTGGLRRESFDSVGSFTSSNGGPLSPMTPHQASLIPSQLFDMLDDVEMPASPTPFAVQDPHHTFTQGISDAFDHAGRNTDVEAGTTLQPHHHQQQHQARSSRAPGMYSPWADFDMDAGFDFDKPLGYAHGHGNSVSAGVSRKPSGRDAGALAQHADLLRRRSGSPLPSTGRGGGGAFDSATDSTGEGVFASYGPSHDHSGSTGSAGTAGGQRSNTSSSGGSISPSLTAAAQGHQQQQQQGLNSNILPPGFGKLSPNDLLFDKARHVLSLNPDAKAFNFNRPLPSSGSAGSLSSIGGGGTGSKNGLPSNAVGAIGDARYAFDSAGAGGPSHIPGSESPNLLSGSIVMPTGGNATWASPNLSSRGLHNLGYGNAGHAATGAGNGNLRESVRSASGPPLTTSTTTGGTTSSSFSPFDDDDLLRGW